MLLGKTVTPQHHPMLAGQQQQHSALLPTSGVMTGPCLAVAAVSCWRHRATVQRRPCGTPTLALASSSSPSSPSSSFASFPILASASLRCYSTWGAPCPNPAHPPRGSLLPLPAVARGAALLVTCIPPGVSEPGASQGPAFSGGRRPNRVTRRKTKSNTAAPAPAGTGNNSTTPMGSGGGTGGGGGPAPSPVTSPVSPSTPGGGGGSGVATAAVATATVEVAAALAAAASDGGESEYESLAPAGNHIVPFAIRQPRALVLDCAYRPINVLTWYKAFHFDFYGRGEVLEYYPPPAVCTTGSGQHPLPAVLRVPQYTADVMDLCSRVACTRRNVMVRDGFCCQYCGSRRDLTIDHMHPVSKGGKETWDNLVTACMRCNQKKSDRSLRDLGWKLKRKPKEPTPFEIGIVAGIATSDILRPPPEWEAYISPYREKLETHRRAALEAGLSNLIEEN